MERKRFSPVAALLVVATLLPATPDAGELQGFASGAGYEVCFTPGMDCEGMIVNALAGAHSSVRLQAYSFTSAPIAKAIVDAFHRGVKVEAILDKSQRTARYSGATFLANAGIPVLIDEEPAIAHNKIIFIDGESARPVLVTGSSNFTKAAQRSNAENLLVISGDRKLTALYLRNFERRQALSVPYER
jgi:phosphatidylserine/phosphatidylglycerophosphate/cardiolipin synthase-like enzyme